MKLANHLTIRLCGLFILILSLWSVIYFLMQMHEIYDDIDEGLTNLKQEFIVQADNDSAFVESMVKYNPFNMIVEEIDYEKAIDIKEEHTTTKVYFETEKEFEEVRILTTAFRCEANGKYYSIKFFTSTVESDDLIENMLFLLICLWITLSLMIIFGGKYIIERSSKPFNKLLEKLHDFSLDNTKMIEIPKTNISEFKALNNAVEALLKENIQAYNEQKAFIENASHELQTPLTVIISKIELMMNSQNISEEQISDLSIVLSNLNRMKRLNSSLLLLSKIKNKQFVENTDVNILEVLEDVRNNFSDIIEHRGLSLSIEQIGVPTVKMNADLAHIMISNLMKNAVNYNILNGRIEIKLTTNSITISNDGKPISEGLNIFDRYISNNTSDSSTGLGLSIVSSIISVYRFKIEHSYNTMHHISIQFS